MGGDGGGRGVPRRMELPTGNVGGNISHSWQHSIFQFFRRLQAPFIFPKLQLKRFLGHISSMTNDFCEVITLSLHLKGYTSGES